MTIALLFCFICVGALFFASGYIMSRGLMHATIPQHKKRTSNINAAKVLSTDSLVDLSEEPDIAAFTNLDTLSGLFNRKVTRTPSSDIEKRKLEPLLQTGNVYIRNPCCY